MGSVIVELQRDALDRNVHVSDLLRKSLVVARKLALNEFQHWIELELNGYDKAEDIPSYRVAHGQVRGWNPFRGWIPVQFESPTEARLLSKRDCGQSVAELESLIESKNSTGLHMPYPPEIQQRISKSIDFPTDVSLFVSLTAIVKIVDAVRTVVLNWALKLEEDGVAGEGMSFTAGEKKSAQQVPQNINNFYGSVHNSQIQQGRDHLVQVAPAPMDTAAIRDLVQLVRTELQQLELSDDQKSEAEAELRTLEAQVQSPTPKPTIMREGLRSLRSVFEKAGGGAAAHLLVKLGELLV